MLITLVYRCHELEYLVIVDAVQKPVSQTIQV